MEHAHGSVVLGERNIEIRSRIFRNEIHLAVLRDADDLDIRPIAGQAAEVVADCVFPRPQFPGQVLIDHSDKLGVTAVAVVNRAAAHNFDSHGAEIIRIHHVEAHGRYLVGRETTLTLAPKRVQSRAVIAHGNGVCKGSGLDAGQRANAVAELAIEIHAALLVVSQFLHIHGEVD